MMNIQGWIVGIIIFATVYIMFSVTQPIMDKIIAFAHASNTDPNVWPLIDFVQTMFTYSVYVSAAAGLAYIIWSNFIAEAESKYGY